MIKVKKIYTKNIIRALWPAITVLFVSVLVAIIFGNFAFLSGTEAVWKIFVRFLRHSANLIIPVMLLPLIFFCLSLIFNRGSRRLIIIREDFEFSLSRLHSLLIRPFQGISFVMLFATKLIAFLDIYSGSPTDPAIILFQNGFNLMRFTVSTSIGIVTALLLASIWGLNDIGIRCYNKKKVEIQKLGKKFGVILSIVFGFYGIFQLQKNNPALLAIYYIFQMVIVLYPAFFAFSLFHSWYIRKYRLALINRLRATPANIDCIKDLVHEVKMIL
jgi:hypothetical protein